MLGGSAAAAILCLVALSPAVGAPQELAKREADSLERKLNAIIARGNQTGKGGRALRTPFTDREINAYFKHQGAQHLPAGVINPQIFILDSERIVGLVTADLDAVRRARSRALTDPLAWVSGSIEINIVGKLHAVNGRGTFELQMATVGGVPIPRSFLQEVVSYYTRTPALPSGFNIDQPFDLPQQIRQVELQRGSAIIVQ